MTMIDEGRRVGGEGRVRGVGFTVIGSPAFFAFIFCYIFSIVCHRGENNACLGIFGLVSMYITNKCNLFC